MKKKKLQTKKLLGIALLVGGVALCIFGIYLFVEFRQSFGGKASSFGNDLSRSFGGSSKLADGYVKPILLIVAGAAAGAAGFFFYKKR